MADWSALSEPFRRFLITDEKTPETARTYVNNAARYWRWCVAHEVYPVEADKPVVQTWLAQRRAEVSSGRVHNDLAAVRKLYEWLIDTGLSFTNPTAGLRIKRPKILPTAPLEGIDVDHLLGACRHERDSLIVLLLVYSGVRITEFANMSPEHIDWHRGEIRIFGKGQKERLVAPADDVMDRLQMFLGLLHEGPIWRSLRRKRPMSGHQIRKIIYRIAEQAGLSNVHPHRFRSTFATEFMEQFGDIQALQAAMGHESIETTARYAEYTKHRRGLEKMRRLQIGATPQKRILLRLIATHD